MGEVSGGNCSTKKHTLSLSQRYFDFSNFDVSSGNGFINSHTISQCDDSITVKVMGGSV